jgi:hypothetical protein
MTERKEQYLSNIYYCNRDRLKQEKYSVANHYDSHSKIVQMFLYKWQYNRQTVDAK